MGNCTSSRKSPAKEESVEALPVLKKCPFCNHENCVESKMHKAQGTARFSCHMCFKTFQRRPYLHEPQDVYNYYLVKYGIDQKMSHYLYLQSVFYNK